MMKCISIFLTVFICLETMFPNMDLCCELPKLSDYVGHYLDSHSDTDLFTFHSEHFGEPEHDKGNKSENLPDHNCSQCCHGMFYLTMEPSMSYYVLPDNLMEKVAFYLPPFTADFIDSLLEPPKA